MSDDVEKVRDRIKKLLAMAADATSPNEAAIAASRARKLMDKYQLSVDDLALGQDKFGTAYIGKAYQYYPMWKNILAVQIAASNDVMEFTAPSAMEGGGVGWRIVYKGLDDDVQLAQAMYNYLEGLIERWCKVYMRHMGYKSYVASVGDSFKKGMAKAVNVRLRAENEGRQDQLTPSGMRLVVVKNAKVTDHFGKSNARTRDVNVLKGLDMDDGPALNALAAGHQTGSHVPLRPELESTAEKPRVLQYKP